MHLKLTIGFLCILTLTLLVRLPGQQWGIRNGENNHYHPDEDRLLRNAYEVYEGKRPSDYYPLGYPVQVGIAARILGIEADNFWNLLAVGRAVSLFYALLTVGLIWFLAAEVGTPPSLRWVPSLCYALSGLPVVYSHYATADTTLAFFFAATILAALRAYRQRTLRWVLLCSFLCGVAIGVKLPFVLLIPVIAVSLRCRRRWTALLLSLIIVPLIAEATCLFSYNFYRIEKMSYMIRLDNVGVVSVHDYLANPLVFAFELLPSLGLVILILVLSGLFRLLYRFVSEKRVDLKKMAPVFWCMILPAFLWFVSVCMMPIPFPRHILLLLPLILPLSVAGLNFRGKRMAAVALLCILYQFAYISSIEGQYVTDTRVEMDAWLPENMPEDSFIYYCLYSRMHKWDSKPLFKWRNEVLFKHDMTDSPYILLHEAFYRRHIRSLVNPFCAYPKQTRVFHHKGFTKWIQQILNEDGYEEIKRFPVRYWTPELILYKYLLGSFPDFAGDTVLYRKL